MLAIPWFHSGKDSIFSFLKIVAVKFCQYLKHLQDALVFLLILVNESSVSTSASHRKDLDLVSVYICFGSR